MNSNVLYLCSPIPPSVNHYLKLRVIKRNGKLIPMAYESGETVKFKESFSKYVTECASLQNWPKDWDRSQHFYCDCVFYFSRMDMDTNNYFKCLLDAITMSKSVWRDDSIVCERVMKILYDKDNPRIEITIYPVEYCGVFESREEMESFESKCKTCRRYGRNCSILKDCKAGKIRNEVTYNYCTEYKENKNE